MKIDLLSYSITPAPTVSTAFLAIIARWMHSIVRTVR